jgi:thymidylate synthase
MKCLFVSGNNIKDVWLETILEVLKHGIHIKTSYDRKGDPPSRDATVMIEITNPTNKPITIKNKELRVKSKHGNKYNIYGHPADLYLIESIKSGYIEEMMIGVNDHLIIDSETSFPYTYHDRLFNYTAYGREDHDKIKYKYKLMKLNGRYLPRVDQIKQVIKKLKESPFSRRIQATTWRPYSDPFRPDPPCLQRIWFRILDNKLYMETTWRSRDLFKAWSANVNAMITLQQYVAYELNVEIGSYIDISNSLHIYGKDLKELKELLSRIYSRNDYSSTLEGLFSEIFDKK